MKGIKPLAFALPLVVGATLIQGAGAAEAAVPSKPIPSAATVCAQGKALASQLDSALMLQSIGLSGSTKGQTIVIPNLRDLHRANAKASKQHHTAATVAAKTSAVKAAGASTLKASATTMAEFNHSKADYRAAVAEACAASASGHVFGQHAFRKFSYLTSIMVSIAAEVLIVIPCAIAMGALGGAIALKIKTGICAFVGGFVNALVFQLMSEGHIDGKSVGYAFVDALVQLFVVEGLYGAAERVAEVGISTAFREFLTYCRTFIYGAPVAGGGGVAANAAAGIELEVLGEAADELAAISEGEGSQGFVTAPTSPAHGGVMVPWAFLAGIPAAAVGTASATMELSNRMTGSLAGSRSMPNRRLGHADFYIGNMQLVDGAGNVFVPRSGAGHWAYAPVDTNGFGGDGKFRLVDPYTNQCLVAAGGNVYQAASCGSRGAVWGRVGTEMTTYQGLCLTSRGRVFPNAQRCTSALQPRGQSWFVQTSRNPNLNGWANMSVQKWRGQWRRHLG